MGGLSSWRSRNVNLRWAPDMLLCRGLSAAGFGGATEVDVDVGASCHGLGGGVLGVLAVRYGKRVWM